MRFFFDNCVSFRLAESIDALTKYDGHSAVALRAMFPARTDDNVWIEQLAQDAEEWAAITADLGEPAEPYRVSALAGQRLRVFVLRRGWAAQTFWLQAQRLVQWWPTIQNDAVRSRPGTIDDVPYPFTRGRSLRRK